MMFVFCRICSVFLSSKLKDTLFKRPELDRKLTCAHSFGLRVLTGLTHIFGLRQKSRQEADPSSSLAESTSSLPLPNLFRSERLTINIQTAIKMLRKVAGRATVMPLLLSAVLVRPVLHAYMKKYIFISGNDISLHA